MQRLFHQRNHSRTACVWLTLSLLAVPAFCSGEDSTASTDSNLSNPQVTAAPDSCPDRKTYESPQKEEIKKLIRHWWNKDAVPYQIGGVYQLPLGLFPIRDVTNCTNCKARTENKKIQQIIVHSTNDGPHTSFPGLLTFLIDRVKTPCEEPFATYYIDYDGRIAQLVPDEIQTAHIGGLNKGKIGIELFDPPATRGFRATDPPPRTPDYDNRQFLALASLIQTLRRNHTLLDKNNNVCLHREFTDGLKHQDPYHMDDAEWQAFLTSQSLVPCSVVKFSQASYSVSKTAGTATIGVTREGPLNKQATVEYAVSNGTALSGADYNPPLADSLTFGPGATTQTFSVPILNNDSNTTSRVANLTLKTLAGNTSDNPSRGIFLGDPQTATLTITSDSCPDPSPNITVFDWSGGYVYESKPVASFTLTQQYGSSVSAIGSKGNVRLSASTPGYPAPIADVSARYRDTFVVTSPGKSGTGQALFSFSPSLNATVSCDTEGDGFTAAGAFANAGYSDGVVVAGVNVVVAKNCIPNNADGEPTSPQSSSFIYGASHYIDVLLRANAKADIPNNTSASSSASIGYSVTVPSDPDAKVTWCRAAP